MGQLVGGNDKNYSFNKRKNIRNTGSGTKEADSLGVGPAKHAGSLSTQKKNLLASDAHGEERGRGGEMK